MTNLFLTVLEAGRPRSKYQHGMFHCEASFLNHLPKAPAPNTITSRARASACRYWVDTNIQAIAP